MEKKKVLFIFQEITPYLPESEKSNIGRYLPQGIQERGKEIRTFMPRYGAVNERRNQLHEVIRLSGMNLVINDSDHPLIIKVASIQAARMQVYFIDNDDYFSRKHIAIDKTGEPFKDNDERALFFAKGVLETVIKLRWTPDLIHCNGWFSAFVPLLIKKTYANDPLFANAKVIYSPYDDHIEAPLDLKLADKLINEDISMEDIKLLEKPSYVNLNKLAVQFSDGIVQGSPVIHSDIRSAIEQSKKPFLEFQSSENYIDVYNDFYDQILSTNN